MLHADQLKRVRQIELVSVPPHNARTRARARDHHVWRSSKSLYTGRRPVDVNAWVASLPGDVLHLCNRSSKLFVRPAEILQTNR